MSNLLSAFGASHKTQKFQNSNEIVLCQCRATWEQKKNGSAVQMFKNCWITFNATLEIYSILFSAVISRSRRETERCHFTNFLCLTALFQIRQIKKEKQNITIRNVDEKTTIFTWCAVLCSQRDRRTGAKNLLPMIKLINFMW